MFITLTHAISGKIRVNFNLVCSYSMHLGGSMIKFNFAAQSSDKLIVQETPEQIDMLLHAAKK